MPNPSQDLQTALSLASRNGRDEVVRALLVAKATVNTRDEVSSLNQYNPSHSHPYNAFINKTSETPIWKASCHGHQNCTHLLIESGASVDVPQEVSILALVTSHTLPLKVCGRFCV